MNPVVHFELGYKDRERAKKFYSETFGWKMQQMGPEMGNYVVAQTAETDEKGMIQEPGAINGGLYQKTDNPSSHAPSFVISVPDIRAAMQKVVESGGQIAGTATGNKEPDMIPGVGLWISCIDTEDNRFSLLQPLPRM